MCGNLNLKKSLFLQHIYEIVKGIIPLTRVYGQRNWEMDVVIHKTAA